MCLIVKFEALNASCDGHLMPGSCEPLDKAESSKEAHWAVKNLELDLNRYTLASVWYGVDRTHVKQSSPDRRDALLISFIRLL